ncbi:L,D-transpeptidase family protein [Peptostreptococcus sp. D1]|uniref:L,D-transpeptidase family protein n=1 Tax=Peptostreptococcus sp. D1 TaxID=72304 RepID=UPI0008E309DE|nr:L,D-transpeptidase family protein [Peptostreptococcus sp. D1]SFE21544.1 Putative peptidoglycan binding domain-containing protein [Peptostreptococcus sp. D1]
MSRVERKRLEKERKKKTRFFVKSSDNFTADVAGYDKEKLNFTDKIKENKSKKSSSDEYYAKEIEKMKSSDSYGKDATSNSRLMTADKIISVEDERMILERRKRNLENQNESDANVMTVDDIFTAEDIENGITESVPKVQKEKNLKMKKSETNINEIKRIKIENATFEDEVKVAESRLAAQGKEANMGKEDITPEKNEQTDEKSKDNIEEKEIILEEIKVNKEGAVGEKAIKSAPIQTEINDVEDPEKGSGIKRAIKKFFGAIVIILLVIYGIGCFIFSMRFFPNTIVNGIDVSYKTPDQLDKLAADKIEGYKLVIEGRNNVKDSIAGSSVALEYVKDSSAKKVKSEQGFFGWPLALYKGESIDGKLNIKYDKDKFERIVSELNIFKKENIKEPVSPYPDYDEKGKKVVINKGDLGSTPKKEAVYAYVSNMLVSEATSEKYPDSVYKAQKNNASNPKLEKAVEFIQPYTENKIEYDFGYEKYTATGKAIVGMFDIDSEGNYDVKLSKDKVREFVRGLSRKYSTYGDTREIDSASTGGKLKVSGGIYGWLIDREKETDELYKLVSEKKNIANRTPIYYQTAMSRDKNDMGDEFIEIDLSKQYMWYVRKGEVLVSTPIVSGQPGKGDATPTGIYPLNYKTRNATLRGPGYSSPVSYWMPFNGNIGIHDANWQPYFGGSRYLFAGSHGCINTPYGKAAKFYSLAKEGMPVVVHN